MANVLFVDKFGKHEVRTMRTVPCIGDSIPVFKYHPFPKVTEVLWFPEEAFPGIKNSCRETIHVMITVE